jgi:hypothetical protein
LELLEAVKTRWDEIFTPDAVCQQKLRAGEVPEIFPYHQVRRLVTSSAIQTSRRET